MKRSLVPQQSEHELADPKLLDEVSTARARKASEREVRAAIQGRPESILATLKGERRKLALSLFERAADAFAKDAEKIHQIVAAILEEIGQRDLSEFSNKDLMMLARTMSKFVDPIERNVLFPKPLVKDSAGLAAQNVTVAALAALVAARHQDHMAPASAEVFPDPPDPAKTDP